MKFFISTESIDNGSGIAYERKKEFLVEIEAMVDDCIANGGTYFDVNIDSDASCFCNEMCNDIL